MMNISNILQIYENDDDKLEKAKITTIKTDDCRVLFTCNLHDTSIKHSKIRYLSRGIIFDGLDHNLLSIPSKTHSYFENVQKDKLKDIYEQNEYDIIEARDGTNITLYNFNGTLCMGTGRSVDVSHFYWASNKTFAQMFYESAQTNKKFIEDTELQVTDNGGLRWNVPSKFSVTIGFRHHDIHQNLNDPSDIWFIRSVDRDKNIDVTVPQLSSLRGNTILIHNTSYGDMVKKCKRDVFIDQEEGFYGYILFYNGDEDIPIELERVFYPSILYKTLQHFFYSFTKKSEDSLTHHNRYMYSIFRNILLNNTSELNLLCRLNPKYKNYITDYNTFIDTICVHTSTKFQDFNYGNNEKSTNFKEFVNTIINNIKQNEPDISDDISIIIKLVNDYVRDPSNTKTIVTLYQEKLNTA